LIDYLPKDCLIILDESHMTLPQLRGMYKGDRSRKQTLVDYGFGIPSALDNRCLMFEEFLEQLIGIDKEEDTILSILWISFILEQKFGIRLLFFNPWEED